MTAKPKQISTPPSIFHYSMVLETKHFPSKSTSSRCRSQRSQLIREIQFKSNEKTFEKVRVKLWKTFNF